jgi:hypothetical protein
MHRFQLERFNLRKLKELEGKEQYHVEISSTFRMVENLGTEADIKRDCETVSETINISVKKSLGYYEFKKHKPWLDEGCSELLDQWQKAKLPWLQHPSNINGYNWANTRFEASRH